MFLQNERVPKLSQQKPVTLVKWVKKLADGNGEVWIRVASRVRRTVLGTYSQKEGLHGKKRIVRLHKITAKDDNI